MSIKLPDVVILEILKKCTNEDKRTARLVCVDLNKLIQETHRSIQLFSDFCPVLNAHTLSAVRAIHPNWRIPSVLITGDNDMISNREELIRFMKNVTILIINQEGGKAVIPELSLLKLIKCSSGNLTSVSLMGQTLFSLKWRTYAYLDFNMHQLSNLETLKIGFEGRENRKAVLVFLAGIWFQKLKTFSILIADSRQPKLSSMEYKWISILIGRHWRTLKHLEIEDNGFGLVDTLTSHILNVAESIRVSKIPIAKGTSLPLNYLIRVRLESFTLIENLMTNQGRWGHQASFLRVQDSLKRLTFGVDWLDAINPFRMAVQKSSNTLEYLKYKTKRLNPFCQDCAYLMNCNVLRELHLESRYNFFNLAQIPISVEIFGYDARLTGHDLQTIINHQIHLKKFVAYISNWSTQVSQALPIWLNLLQFPGFTQLEIYLSHFLFSTLVQNTTPFRKRYIGKPKIYWFDRFGTRVTIKCRSYRVRSPISNPQNQFTP